MKAFISYSHHDERYLDRLHVHLATLEREGRLTAWHDREISAGSNIDTSIKAAFDDSSLFIALVSPDFIASNYCYERELSEALKRHEVGTMTVIALICEPCDWKSTPLSAIKVLPKDGKPISDWGNENNAYLNVIEELRRLIQEVPSAPSRSGSTVDSSQRGSNPVDKGRYRPKVEFDNIDKKKFRDESFGAIEKRFDQFLDEFNQVAGLKGHKSSSNESFEVFVTNKSVRNGDAYLRVRKGSDGGISFGDINFVTNENAGANTSNGGFNVSNDDFEQFLTPQFLGVFREMPERLSPDEAAEFLWAELMTRAKVTYA